MRLRPVTAILIGESGTVQPTLSLDAVKCLLAAREPVDASDLISSGHEQAAIDELLSARLLQAEPNFDDPYANWFEHGWSRGADLVLAAERARAAGARDPTLPATTVGAPFDQERVLARRSFRLFSGDAAPEPAASSLGTTLARVRPPSLAGETFLVAQRLEGLDEGIYELEADGRWTLRSPGYDRSQLLSAAQGMWWVEGGGGVVFFASSSLAPAGPYVETLVSLGRDAQAILTMLYSLELGAWLTPALNEVVARDLLGLESSQSEPLYMIKFGVPRPDERDHYARNMRMSDTPGG